MKTLFYLLCTKPSVSIEDKQYQLINQYYYYPGIAKWEPIEIKFVDGAVWGSQDGYITEYTTKTDRLISRLRAGEDGGLLGASNVESGGFKSAAATKANFPAPIDRMTSAALWEMLVASGYTQGISILSDRALSIASPEKAQQWTFLLVKSLKYINLNHKALMQMGSFQSSETWEIFNPITKFLGRLKLWRRWSCGIFPVDNLRLGCSS